MGKARWYENQDVIDEVEEYKKGNPMTDTKELKPCKYEAAKWKGEACQNGTQGWITDSRGQRLTRLGNRNVFGKLIQAHNKEIELLQRTSAALSPDTVTLSKEEFERVKEALGVAWSNSDDTTEQEFYAEALAILDKHGG